MYNDEEISMDCARAKAAFSDAGVRAFDSSHALFAGSTLPIRTLCPRFGQVLTGIRNSSAAP